TRFRSEFRKRIASSDPAQQAAAATLVGEMATAVPSTRDLRLQQRIRARQLLIRDIVPDLGALARSSEPAVRSAAARAIGRILANAREERGDADTKSAFDTLTKLFDAGDARTQRAVANALADFVRVFSHRTVDPRDTAPIGQADLDVITDRVVPLAFRTMRE